MLLPIELDGTAVPSSLIAVTSITATLRWPRKPWRIQMAEWDRCMSEYSETPLLIIFRMIGSDWYGARNEIPPVSASAPSSSGAVEAPVYTPMRNSSPCAWAALMRVASAPGTAFG